MGGISPDVHVLAGCYAAGGLRRGLTWVPDEYGCRNSCRASTLPSEAAFGSAARLLLPMPASAAST